MSMDNPNNVPGELIPFRQIEKEWQQANYRESCGTGQCLCLVAPANELKLYRAFNFEFNVGGNDGQAKFINGSDDELQYDGMPFEDGMISKYGPQRSGKIALIMADKSSVIGPNSAVKNVVIRPHGDGNLVTPRVKIWQAMGNAFQATISVTWTDYDQAGFNQAFAA